MMGATNHIVVNRIRAHHAALQLRDIFNICALRAQSGAEKHICDRNIRLLTNGSGHPVWRMHLAERDLDWDAVDSFQF